MGQVHPRGIPLKDVVDRAHVVLEVQPCLVFLARGQDGWEFCVAGALEGLGARKEVEGLLKKR